MKKTWRERLNADKKPMVKVLEKRFADIPAGTRMVVVTPLIVDKTIRRIPMGAELPIKALRHRLAKTYKADYACPVSTAIFVRIAAEVAYEDFNAGKKISEITPFWRVIDDKSNLAQKLSFGIDFLLQQRRKENL